MNTDGVHEDIVDDNDIKPTHVEKFTKHKKGPNC